MGNSKVLGLQLALSLDSEFLRHMSPSLQSVNINPLSYSEKACVWERLCQTLNLRIGMLGYFSIVLSVMCLAAGGLQRACSCMWSETYTVTAKLTPPMLGSYCANLSYTNTLYKEDHSCSVL